MLWPEKLKPGETREISIEVVPSTGTAAPAFVSATYRVLRPDGTELQASTNAVTSGSLVSGALINPPDAGPYTVEFTYTIGSETYKASVAVVVE